MMIKTFKRIGMYTLCGIEICVFSWTYVYGQQGWRDIWSLQKDNEHMQQCINSCKQDTEMLEQELIAWKEHSFYKEKVAREQLQMAHAHEIIYYTS